MIKKLKKTEAQFVLIVENGLMNLKLISDALQKEGFYVMFVSDTETALKVLVQVRPFLILMGLVMSKLDRCTFTRILKNDEDTSNIIIIALSDANPDRERIISCGFNGLINMEESKNKFAKEIRKILNKKKN